MLIIGGVWLALVIVAGVAFSRIGRNLNRHVEMPGDADDVDVEPPGPGPDPPAG
jgi:hypothetical protein